MKTSPRPLSRRWAAAGILLATVILSGCSAESAPGHDKRLSKAAGLARITLICPKDLWEETRPKAGVNQVKAKVTEITSGPRANRGLVRVTMSGTNLVSYLEELDDNAHPDPLGVSSNNEAASKRVYEALAPAIDRVENARSEKDPEPEIVIDDTIRDKK